MSTEDVRRFLADVQTQLNGCDQLNSRSDQTPFGFRLTHDRAVDMTTRIADIYLLARPQLANRVAVATGNDRRLKAYLRISIVVADLRQRGHKGLPDLEDLESAIRERGRSVHEAAPTTSTKGAAVEASQMAGRLMREVALEILPAK